MGDIPAPATDGAIWDYLTLGSNVMPGVWSATGANERRIDVKKPKGREGAKFKDLGREDSLISLRGRMVTDGDWDAMQKAQREIDPEKAPHDPLAVDHVSLNYLGITAVILKKAHTPRTVEGGIIEVAYDVIRWVEKPKVTPKPVALKGFSVDESDADFKLIRRLSPSQDTPTYVGGVAPF